MVFPDLTYLPVQSARLEYMKVWKGLYFAMWMADKRPVQQAGCPSKK